MSIPSKPFIFRFNGALSLELSNEHPNLRIIHRKVAIILGQWVSEVCNLSSVESLEREKKERSTY